VPAVRLSGVRKTFGDVVAVEDLTLDVLPGEFFTMLGPSGSGKTTTLRVIAGFELADAGTVELHGVDVTRSPPYERPLNTVFQDYALFPHMSVTENVAYGLRALQRERAGRHADRDRSPTPDGQAGLLAFALSFDEIVVTTADARHRGIAPGGGRGGRRGMISFIINFN
jgi:ABC-type branched-subunit amino acid transport system ATPase component